MKERIWVRVEPEVKAEMEEIARRLTFSSVSELIRALYLRPDIYGPAVQKERENLKKESLLSYNGERET